MGFAGATPSRHTSTGLRLSSDAVLLPAAVSALAIGGFLYALDRPDAALWVFFAGTAIVLAPTAYGAIRAIARRQTGVDVVAVLAMVAALVLGEPLVGVIIAVMLASGSALERFAVGRARREISALLARAPRVAHRRAGEDVVDVEVSALVPGDTILVKPGEVLPADGIVVGAPAVLDQSALTGEAAPASVLPGDVVRSGATNVGGPLELRVRASAEKSTYESIVRLVAAAEASKSKLVRLADRYAGLFVFVALAIAAVAWVASRDPVRALAVLVVATPCPLILAAPAAIIAGVSRAARHGILAKGGAPLETLARMRVLLLDKTGTITAGRPQVIAVESFGPLSDDELVRLAASAEQVSVHPFAPAILAEARDRGLDLSFPTNATEAMGSGIEARVGGTRVKVGQRRWVAPSAPMTAGLRSIDLRTAVEGSSSVFVSADGALAGVLVLQDPIRAEAPRALRALRKAGVQRIHMITGDHPDVADLVGDVVGVDRVFAERAPDEKVEVVRLVRAEGVTAMVGDGVNDAPALALADVGVAMGARGAAAAAEAADIVLTADRLEGLLLGVHIAKQTRHIALESVLVGMGLSFVAMIAAAGGFIAPVAGAILQEGIDVAVILNALRALGGRGHLPKRGRQARELGQKLETAHRTLRPRIGELSSLAARLDQLPPATARAELDRARVMLENEILPHEREEQATAYPVIVRLTKDEDPTGPLIRTHHEIHRLVRLYARLVDRLPAEGPSAEDLRDLRRALYGLHAVLTLHFAQEDELYSMLET